MTGSKGNPADQLRQRVGDRAHPGGFLVDVNGRADDDVAKIVGTGYRGNDRHEAEWSAFVRTRQIDPPPT